MDIKTVYIVEPISQYKVLNYFNEQIASGFRECGVNAVVTSSYKMDDEGHVVGISESDLVLAFNGACSGDFVEVISRDGIPYWSFMVDHPYYHYPRLSNIGSKQIVSVIDRRHLEYLETYYPSIKHKTFMPHGGACAKENHIPFADKKYDISFFGTYRDPEACIESLKKYDEPMKRLLLKIVDDVWAGREKTLEDSVLHNFNKHNLLEDQNALVDIMPELCVLDEYLRYKRRDLLIRVALETGFEVHVFGNGWKEFTGYTGDNLNIHDNVEYADSLDVMANSKIVLNNMPLFADGSHERVFSILASGSICLTDSNPYLEENFVDGEDLFYYHWDNIYRVPETIKDIMAERFDVEGIIESGRNKVTEKHMWVNRAREILDYCRTLKFEGENKSEQDWGERMKTAEILDMMQKILIFISDNIDHISQAEMGHLFDELTKTFIAVNEELFHSRELTCFKIGDIKKQGAYEDYDIVIDFFEKWHRFISNIIQQREALPNNVDAEFKCLMDYARYVDREWILLNAKKSLLAQSPDYVKRINAYYHKFHYLWGDMDIFNDQWDVLEDRVNSLVENCADLEWLYDKLGDYRSKLVLTSMLYSWIYFDPIYITRMKEGNFRDYYDLDLLQCDENEVVVDLGAYIGDSAMDYIKTYRKYKRIYCYEISEDSIAEMQENLKPYNNIEIVNKGVGSENTYMYVNKTGTSDASGNMLGEKGDKKVQVVTLDHDIQEPVTLIKMDIEGAEQDALKGCIRHIKEERPKLLICVYHNNRDVFEIPKWIYQVRDDYKFYMRSNGLQYGPSEIVLFAL